MALVTVQRSPSPSRGHGFKENDSSAEKAGHSSRSRRSHCSKKKFVNTINTIKFVNRLRFSESYFTIKGAALILPKNDQIRVKKCKTKSSIKVSDIQHHLQSMFHELRPDDTIQVAIKLESSTDQTRYLAIAVTEGINVTEEGIILGFHCTESSANLGLVLPIYQNTEIALNGDGGFRIVSEGQSHIFKPISVQAMWSALLSLNKVCDTARKYSYCRSGPTHAWMSFYTRKLTSNQLLINEWELLDDLMVSRSDLSSTALASLEADNGQCLEAQIRHLLRELMVDADLEEVTSYELRMQMEGRLNRSLTSYKSFIDQEMLLVVRQLDGASQIFDFLFLGSEWNASNLQELNSNGVGFILNVTREIDNFFPGMFKYMNVRLYDEENVDLMKYWENTHGFICRARDNNSKILVHCKMGVSRSASTVIAFAMKEYNWSLEEAFDVVKTKRNVIKPSDTFMQQLRTYEGILNASKQRWNPKFKSESLNQKSPFVRDSYKINNRLSDAPLDGHPESETAQNQGSSVTCDPDACTASQKYSESDRQEEDYDIPNNLSSSSNTDNSDSDNKSSSDNNNRFKDENKKVKSVKRSPSPSICIVWRKRPNLSSNKTSSAHSNRQMNTKSLPDMPSDHLKKVATCPAELVDSAVVTDDEISLCNGIVKKAKEVIESITSSSSETSCLTADSDIPCTPGTVRKVLRQFEGRSSSFKLLRKRPQSLQDHLQRSASLRESKCKQSPEVTISPEKVPIENKETCSELYKTFKKIQLDKGKRSPIDFKLGGDESETDRSDAETLVEKNIDVKGDKSHADICRGQNFCDSLLKVSSKPSTSPDGTMAHNQASSVKRLKETFEDIGAVKTPARPLTIHVDSFNSDAFANFQKQQSLASPILHRSHSLKALEKEKQSVKPKTKFDIKHFSSSAQKILKPYWKMKRDSLIRCSTSTGFTPPKIS